MAAKDKALVKSSVSLDRFDPKAHNKLVIRGLIAFAEVRDADFYFLKGLESYDRGEVEQAIDYWKAALRTDPERAGALLDKRGIMLFKDQPADYLISIHEQSKQDESLESYREALRLDPNDPGVPYRLGFTFYERGKLDDARKSWRAFIQLATSRWASHVNLIQELIHKIDQQLDNAYK